MKCNESIIRDNLSKSLDLIEVGLELINTEEFIPKGIGTKGFIDILGKDKEGRYVVIELKKSKASSREALHEVLKYIESIKDYKKLKDDEIRTFIVSTDWEELLLPYSSFYQNSSFSVKGYKLQIDDDCIPIAVEEVQPLELNNERFISDNHTLRMYIDKEKLENGILSFINAYNDKNIEDYILVILSAPVNYRKYELASIQKGFEDIANKFNKKNDISVEKLEQIIPEYKYIIYSSCQVYNKEKYWKLLERNKDLLDEVKEVNIESDEDTLLYSLHENVVENLKPTPVGDWIEIGYPAKFNSLINGDLPWEVIDVKKYGAFARNEQLSDSIILAELCGNSGTNKQKYTKTFDSKSRSSLELIKKDVRKCLVDNVIWQNHIIYIIDEIEKLYQKNEFVGRIHIYNPSNLLFTIYHTHLYNDLFGFLPTYNIYIESDREKRLYYGILLRNKNKPSLQKILKDFYDGDNFSLIMQTTWGGYDERELHIAKSVGFDYKTHLVIENEDGKFCYEFMDYEWLKRELVNPFEEYIKFLKDENVFVSELINLFESNKITNGLYGNTQ